MSYFCYEGMCNSTLEKVKQENGPDLKYFFYISLNNCLQSYGKYSGL